jgi:hypothetical protein
MLWSITTLFEHKPPGTDDPEAALSNDYVRNKILHAPNASFYGETQ